jgi:hypothetical protein
VRKNLTLLFFMTLVAAPSAAVGLGGCGGGDTGGSGGGTSDGPVCFDYAKWDGSTPVVSFKDEVLPLMRRSCGLSSSCHGTTGNPPGYVYLGSPASGPAPTDLEIQAMFDEMLAPAKEAVGMARVKPGAPDQSFLMYKMDGDLSCKGITCDSTLGCGTSMPQSSPILSLDERNLVRRWISQGAKNDLAKTGGTGGSGGT